MIKRSLRNFKNRFVVRKRHRQNPKKEVKMSRIVSGDKNQLPEDEFTNSFRLAIETKHALDMADERALEVIDYSNMGKNAEKLHKLGNKDL